MMIKIMADFSLCLFFSQRGISFMGTQKPGGASVYISPDIIAALNARFEENAEAGKKIGLDPLCLVKPSVGWMVRSHLRAALGMNQPHGGE